MSLRKRPEYNREAAGTAGAHVTILSVGGKQEPHRYMKMQVKLVLAMVGTIAGCGFIAIGILSIIDHLAILPHISEPFMLSTITVLLSVIVGVLVANLLLRHMLEPVHEFTEATEKIGAGDYSVRVETRERNGELWDLQRSFNRMAQELENTELLRNGFVNDFSHEFKTPISSIHGFSKLLLDEGLSDDERREYSRIIYNESERLTDLAANVLTLNKLENQELITDRSWFALDELLRRCILALMPRWEARELEFDPQLDDVRIYANPSLLGEVWMNLLDNAIKFSPKGGCVHVACRWSADGLIEVNVRDEGPGMDPETIERAFDKFYQGDSSHATQGNGIGLSIVKRAVELHNGQIAVNSTPGAGTTFIVTLPVSTN